MKVLFIGNSYTYFNDMPTIFEKLSRDNGIDINVFSVTRGGRKLYEYTQIADEYSEKLEKTIAENEFDAVFLQDHSVISFSDYDMFCTGISALAEKLKGKTKSIILYETWARKEGSPTLAERGLTPDSMYKLISEAYAKLAKTMNFTVSKVGAAFQKAVKEFPDTDLYDPDLTHPSLSGSSLAALIHFKTLFGKLPENTSALALSIELIESMAE